MTLVEIFDKDDSSHTVFFIIKCSDEKIKEINSAVTKVHQEEHYNTEMLKGALVTIDEIQFIYDVTRDGSMWMVGF